MQVIQVGTTIRAVLIKGINTLINAKWAKSFNNAINLVAANIEITYQRLLTLENRTLMMAKAIMPVLTDLKSQLKTMNQKLQAQYDMMKTAHTRYNLLFRQMHETLNNASFINIFIKELLNHTN